MTLPSKAELQQLFEDETLANEAWTSEVVLSWPSLRLLAVLSRQEQASTGDLARAVNMDMREVRDHLEALADVGIVGRTERGWRIETDHVQFELGFEASGLALSHSVGTPPTESPTSSPKASETAEIGRPATGKEEPDSEESTGLLERIRHRIRKYFRG